MDEVFRAARQFGAAVLHEAKSDNQTERNGVPLPRNGERRDRELREAEQVHGSEFVRRGHAVTRSRAVRLSARRASIETPDGVSAARTWDASVERRTRVRPSPLTSSAASMTSSRFVAARLHAVASRPPSVDRNSWWVIGRENMG